MKIVHPEYFDPIIINGDQPETLVIENPVYFRKIVSILLFQSNTEDGDFILSEHDDPIAFNKNCIVISDIYNYAENDHQLKAKIQNMILNEASYSENLTSIITGLNEFGIELANRVTYSVKFKDNITLTDLIKMYDFSIDLSCYEFWEKIIEYMKLCKELLHYKLFITINLKDSISEEEYKNFNADICNSKIPLLMIERNSHENLDDICHLRIVDSDLCVI